MKKLFLMLGIFIILMLANIVQAIPQLMNFQGRLTNSSGDPITDTTTVEFRIWDDSFGGNVLWMESQSVTPNSDGTVNVLLGSVNPIPDSAFAPAEAYLGIKVGLDSEITPRIQLVAVSFAHRIRTIDGATGGEISGKLTIVHEIVAGAGQMDVLSITDELGSLKATIAIDTSGNASMSFYDPLDSKDAAALPKRKVEIRHDGLFMFGLTDLDTSLNIIPNGNIRSNGTIAMGQNSDATGSWSTVFGYNNLASGDSSTVSGGYNNTASEYISTVGGGAYNVASGSGATIAGGGRNNSSGVNSFLGGGYLNNAYGNFSTLSGGYMNIVDSGYCTIAGGANNNATGYSSTVAGGSNNNSIGMYSTVSGGNNNNSTGSNSTVNGGANNIASGPVSTISGGSWNVADSAYCTIGGGYKNTASGLRSTVGGGWHNAASVYVSTVGGGIYDTASGSYSTVPGGVYNKAGGFSSFAAGRYAKAIHGGTFVWADSTTNSPFSSTGGNQFLIKAAGGVGINTNAPSEALTVNGNICYTGQISACSDTRYKTNVESLTNALDNLISMRGVKYNWKVDEFPDRDFSDERQIGFIAQELKEILPEVVMEDANGYMSVDYGRLTPILVEAIKEQQAQIQEQQKQIDELKELVTKIISQSTSTESSFGLK